MPKYTLTCTWTDWGTPGPPPDHNQVAPDHRRNTARGKALAHGVNVHNYVQTHNGGVWQVEGSENKVNDLVNEWRHPQPQGKANVNVDVKDGWV
jgi:hypothetical protein